MNQLRQWTWLILAPLWRWKWLLLVCLLITLGYGLLSHGSISSSLPPTYPSSSYFSALPSFYPSSYPSASLADYTHGWPYEYERRTFVDSKFPQPWRIWTNVTNFEFRKLLANLAIAIGVSLAFTYLVAWRVSQASRWQFRIGDLLALTVVIAAPLGLARYLDSNFRADQEYARSIDADGWRFRVDRNSLWYARPLRDLGMVSDEASRLISISYSAPTGPNTSYPTPAQADPKRAAAWLIAHADRGERIRQPIGTIDLERSVLNDRSIAALARWAPTSEELLVGGEAEFTDQATATIVAAWPRLTRLVLHSPQLTAASLRSITALSQLRDLELFEYSPHITPADLELLADMPNLHTLMVPHSLYVQITPQQHAAWEARSVNVRDAQPWLGEETPVRHLP
ncbi:hypothetical protein [Blastopirellula marina]|uniref:Leucine-rich repeat domain-containing protein n=1 Tax=Blastopirellula marina TaxID=124 RepID=A0A2S8GV98_9BACT|nr:hypothetical protein [Blastopirellula marina]PQO47964.1 hypothetical protein C5Y93_00830 [Blastopirellula marina]